LAPDGGGRVFAGRDLLLRLGGFLILVLIVAALALAYRWHNPQRDYYQPVRTALSEAQVHLSQSYAHEKALMDELGAAQREFATVIRLLKQAAQANPADRERIAEVEKGLQSLKGATERGRMRPDELQKGYQQLQSQLEELLRQAH
jgi:DNA repair ATPase RecN